MAFEGLLHVVSLEILGWMARNSDVIVVDQELDVQVLSNGETSSFCIVTLLLGTIGSEAKDNLVSVRECDTVHVWPHVPETARRELDTGCEAKFGVAGEVGVSCTVVQKFFLRDGALESREEILSRDTMACQSRRSDSYRGTRGV
jgi:hypothetical protein